MSTQTLSLSPLPSSLPPSLRCMQHADFWFHVADSVIHTSKTVVLTPLVPPSARRRAWRRPQALSAAARPTARVKQRADMCFQSVPLFSQRARPFICLTEEEPSMWVISVLLLRSGHTDEILKGEAALGKEICLDSCSSLFVISG